MPSIKFVHFENLVSIFPEGNFTVQSVEESVREIERYEKEKNHAVDRYIDLSVTTDQNIASDEMMMLGQKRKAFFSKYYNGVAVKLAIFADSPLSFGMARVFQSFFEAGTVEVSVFKSRDDAAQWLGVDRACLEMP